MGQFSLNALAPIGAMPLLDNTGKVGEPAEPTLQFTSASSVNLLILAVNLFGVGNGRAEVFAVHLGDVIHSDTFRAGGLAFVKIRAVAESFLVHLGNHGENTLLRFDLALRQVGEMADLRRNKEHRGRVLAGGDTGTTADAGGRVEGAVGISLGNRDRGSFRSGTGVHRNETTGSDNAVESGTVHGAVTDNRECGGAPRFDHDGIAILELAHVKLAGSYRMVRTVRHSVDDQGTHSANSFAAVVIKGKAFLSLLHFAIVHDVEHFQERHIRGNAVDIDRFELAFGLGVLLTPNLESQMHIVAHYL